MGVWDLLYLENQIKKYLELALNPAFDKAQRAKFRELARDARQHLVDHMARIDQRIQKREKEENK